MADDDPATSGDSSILVGSAVYVGGYTGEDVQRRGVEAYRFDTDQADRLALTELAPVPASSPSFLVAHPDRPLLYAVGETSPTTVSALRIAEDGSLELLNTVVSAGAGGCHLAVDETGQYVLVAHYTSGSVSTFGIAADGRLSEELDHHVFSGSGPDADRQDGPHAHQVVPHEGRVLVCDLGTDQVHQLRLDVEGHLRLAADPVALPAGSGPRHLVVSGEHLVVACELTARLWLARREDHLWQEVGSWPTTSATGGECFPSALRLHEGQLLVGNRGPDTVAVFDLDTEHGRLVEVAELSTGGRWPRDLWCSASHLWVANQNSDTVVAFRRPRDGESGYVLDFEIPTAAPAAVLVRDVSTPAG
ncbi:lactonase family protein [Desertihabitans aurantiacus]|uniref:lactonase family protein n=1 Tax=Desertihabitans aurantiacus TaxID=2282477 RepID=UPI000DF759C6|nr:lactonase family protein [Desertihabitans aurantiacus]